MGYKLKGEQLKYCAEHITAFMKRSNGRRLYVDCDDKDSGKKIYMFLSGLYKPKGVEMGFTYKDFTMVFPSTYERDQAYNDLHGAYTEYVESHHVLTDGEEDTPLTQPSPAQPSTPEEPAEKEETKDYTTYIIIGVAVVVIIALLLWDRKR